MADDGQLVIFVVKRIEPSIVWNEAGQRLDDFDCRLFAPFAFDKFLTLRELGPLAALGLVLERSRQFIGATVDRPKLVER